ncbi:MAG: histidine kinase, partial [Segetibacter sp.]|nr:histidine kinase [Segetibacter sp.]
LPVIENNSLAGIISMTDVVAETIISQQEMIAHLQNYLQS